MKIIVTGAAGLIGHHAAVRVHARNCAARHDGESEPFILARLDHAAFNTDERLHDVLRDADAVLHFAGVNRAADADVASGNPDIARRLVAACRAAGVTPHIVYANSTHAGHDSVYGNSKRIAGEILADTGWHYTDLVLPHIFGEGARPDYNNVTATFISRVIANAAPQVNPHGQVALLHAGEAAQIALDAALNGEGGRILPAGRPTPVTELLDRIQSFHAARDANLFPDLSDPFTLALFNCYRAALYPSHYPVPLAVHNDARGSRFEAPRSQAGQTIITRIPPGTRRADHFHLSKVERLIVLDGEAVIRIRPVLGETVRAFNVSGRSPAAIDMPTLHTHHIENISGVPLLFLYWSNTAFDPAAPDTYSDPVVPSLT